MPLHSLRSGESMEGKEKLPTKITISRKFPALVWYHRRAPECKLTNSQQAHWAFMLGHWLKATGSGRKRKQEASVGENS